MAEDGGEMIVITFALAMAAALVKHGPVSWVETACGRADAGPTPK